MMAQGRIGLVSGTVGMPRRRTRVGQMKLASDPESRRTGTWSWVPPQETCAGQMKTVVGEGTGTQTETGTDVDARTGTETENSLGANGLRRLGRLGANTEVATVQTSKHNWTQ